MIDGSMVAVSSSAVRTTALVQINVCTSSVDEKRIPLMTDHVSVALPFDITCAHTPSPSPISCVVQRYPRPRVRYARALCPSHMPLRPSLAVAVESSVCLLNDAPPIPLSLRLVFRFSFQFRFTVVLR